MKNILKKMAVISMIAVSTFGTIGCAKENKSGDNTNSKNKQQVIVGLDNTFVPMGFSDENGELVGFDVDLAKEVFYRLNINVKFQPIDWAMKETELNSGNIDAIWNGYSLSDERKKVVTYTKPYLENKQVIVTMKDSNIKTKKDLKGKKLGIQQGSSALEAIEKQADFVNKLDNKAPILYDTYDNAIRDLEVGRTDAIVSDENLVRYYISKKGDQKYNILQDNFGEESYVVAFKKDNSKLRDKVDMTLNDVKNDGSFDKIYSKWFK
ncbi:amino acid ABC transporter substrate-binding protein [Romboutsia sedimentorum]|uniref:amino acid ABC transporter substrate-binding protein n=1 Tax=Romboutsia sedimentorum TaxID=1368474 RepID=UPI0024DEF2E3|nr:amino acid ABC transporter substrate-binding protein [Romboutsia sedimentorum]MDK2587419.1 amino acid ABC transporter substrate-binding protein [Romboutsia sedimentorum]